MRTVYRNLVFVLLAGILLAGCGKRAQLPVLSAPAAVPPQYTADDTVCGWSELECFECGGGVGVKFVSPIDASSDAVIGVLAGESPAFSSDGELLAMIKDEEVHVWRAEDGELSYTLRGTAFAFGADNRSIALKQDDGWVIWDLVTQEEQYRLSDSAFTLYFSADGRFIVTAEDDDRIVRLYDAGTGTRQFELQGVSTPTAISPNGELLAATRSVQAGAFDIDSIVLWDTLTGAEVQVLQAEIQTEMPLAGMRGHREVYSLAFSPDGGALLSAGRDAVRLWNTTTGEHLRCFQTPDHGGAKEAIWGDDARTIVGIGTLPVDRFALRERVYGTYLWDVEASHPMDMLALTGVLPIAYSAQSDSLLTVGESTMGGRGVGAVYLWDFGTRQLISVLPASGVLVSSAVLSPTGTRAVTISYLDNPYVSPERETLLWDTDHGSLALAAGAQLAYWDALQAALNGKPWQPHLRRAQSLSPELFGNVRNLGEGEKSWFDLVLDRKGLLAAVAGESEEAAEAFYAEVTDVTPRWSLWPRDMLILQVAGYMSYLYGEADDSKEMVAAYREFAELEPEIADLDEIVGALRSEIARMGLELEVVVENLNMRSTPGTSARVLAQVDRGSRLIAKGRVEDASWLYVCCVDGNSGWVINRPEYVRGPAVRNILEFLPIVDAVGSRGDNRPNASAKLSTPAEEAATPQPQVSVAKLEMVTVRGMLLAPGFVDYDTGFRCADKLP